MQLKGNYPRTRASDSKQLPAFIHSTFLVNILGLSLIFGLSPKKLGFTMVLYEKNFEMLSFFGAILSRVLMSKNCCLKALTQKKYYLD